MSGRCDYCGEPGIDMACLNCQMSESAKEAHERGRREGIAEGRKLERADVVAFIHGQREATFLPSYDLLRSIDKDEVRATMAGLKLCIERGKHVAEGEK